MVMSLSIKMPSMAWICARVSDLATLLLIHFLGYSENTFVLSPFVSVCLIIINFLRLQQRIITVLAVSCCLINVLHKVRPQQVWNTSLLFVACASNRTK